MLFGCEFDEGSSKLVCCYGHQIHEAGIQTGVGNTALKEQAHNAAFVFIQTSLKCRIDFNATS